MEVYKKLHTISLRKREKMKQKNKEKILKNTS